MLYNCVYILIYIILGLNHLALCNDNFKCGGCAKEHVKLCQIEQETGFSCSKRDSSDKSSNPTLRKYEHEKAPMSNYVNACIPHGVTITPGAEICCAWSPRTGCNLVLEKQHKGEYCSTCRVKNENYKNLKLCPCTFVSRSGSGQLIWSDLKILSVITVGFCVMRKISHILY